MKNYKKDFPIFSRQRNLVYLDSAATSQKPRTVITAESRWYERHNANAHRGVYRLAEEATALIEAARQKTANFLGAGNSTNIVWVKGATEGINLVARAWARPNLKKGDVILLTEMEHHANIVPWQLLAAEKGLKLRYWPINVQGELVMTDLEQLFKGVKLLAIIHVSNVLGTINPLEKIIKLAKRRKIPVLVDAAQSVGHLPVNVGWLAPDFLTFSVHKMFGPTGLGVLYIAPERHREMRPYQGGGEMIATVGWQHSTFKPVPAGLEAGTLPLAQIFAWAAAIDYLQKVGLANIARHNRELTDYAYRQLAAIPEVKIYGPRRRAGLISFAVADLHAHDLATWLDNYRIAVRAGHHCAMPLHRQLKIPATLRVSFQIYNTKSDVDRLVRALRLIIKQWRSTNKK